MQPARCSMQHAATHSTVQSALVATGYMDDGAAVAQKMLHFPPLAAGGICTARGLATFLAHMVRHGLAHLAHVSCESFRVP